ncbi:MAG: enoyl-CoA hydratase/isomerase family protein [Epsilonproteobacteria bacterium]|nr:enoyl-CoA hydratase/isomerase family protein [Campylobacterota bacterium]
MDKILYKKELSVAKIIINDPPYNVINIAMMENIADAVRKAGSDEEISIIVISAAGDKSFCSGVDVADHTKENTPRMLKAFSDIFVELSKTDKLTVAAARGFAFGGGCELLLGTDLVVADDTLKVGQPEIKLGVFPPVAMILMPEIIGQRNAKELIFSGKTIDAETAKQMGLVNEIFAKEEFDKSLKKYISRFAGLSRSVLRLTKRTLTKKEHLEESFKEMNDVYIEKLMNLCDANEGISAFIEKRKPAWKHS